MNSFRSGSRIEAYKQMTIDHMNDLVSLVSESESE